MPLVRASTVGAQIIASAHVAREFIFTAAAGTTSATTTIHLQVNDLPNATWYLKQTNAVAGGTFTPWFAVQNAAGSLPEWNEVTAPQALVPGVPIIVNQRLVANMITATVTAPVVGGVAVVLILASSQ